jgi:site-specific recombinase XerC
MLEDFRRHLSRCHCPQSNGGRTGYHAQFGLKLFLRHLVQAGVCQAPLASIEKQNPVPPLVAAFQAWFQTHRGVAQPTLRLYSRGATELLGALGEDVSAWTPQSLRAFLLDRAGRCGAETTQKLITSARAFLRYLSFRGEARQDLDLAIPAIAHWRLASLPQCLSAKELDRLIGACDGNTPTRLRDRAIVLLLSRLGLRAADVAQLRFSDINWENGTLQVTGKGRYQVRLPLPQDVGDALLRYLECRPQINQTTVSFFVRSLHLDHSSRDIVSPAWSSALFGERASKCRCGVPTCFDTRQQPRCYAMASLSIR